MAITLWKTGTLALADLFEPIPADRGTPLPSAPVGRRVVLYADGATTGTAAGPAAYRLHLDLSALGEADEIAPDTRLAFTRGGPLLPILRRRYPLRGVPADAPTGLIMDRVTTAFGIAIALTGVSSLGMELRLTHASAARASQRVPSVGEAPDPAKQRIPWFILREDA